MGFMPQENAQAARQEFIRICVDIYACGGTSDLAGAALICHENVDPSEAFKIAAYAFRTWCAVLRLCALRGKPVPAVDKERAAEVLAKVPAITAQARALGPIELIEPTPPHAVPEAPPVPPDPSPPAENQETP